MPKIHVRPKIIFASRSKRRSDPEQILKHIPDNDDIEDDDDDDDHNPMQYKQSQHVSCIIGKKSYRETLKI